MIFNSKRKVHKINNHGEHNAAGSPSDVANIIFYIDRKKYRISFYSCKLPLGKFTISLPLESFGLSCCVVQMASEVNITVLAVNLDNWVRNNLSLCFINYYYYIVQIPVIQFYIISNPICE